MIMKANKQIGFIYKDNESIDKILKDGDVVFERGFLREKTSTTLPITFGGVGKDLKDYKIYGNTYQNSTRGINLYNYKSSDLDNNIDNLTVSLDKDSYLIINGTNNKNYRTPIKGIDITDLLEDGQTYTIYQEDITPSDITNNFSKIEARVARTKLNGTIEYPRTNGKHTARITVDKTNYTKYEINVVLPQAGDTYSNYKNRFMLLKGSYNDDSVPSFEPYTGGQPSPNPDYPQKIISCGDLITDSQDFNYGKYKIPVNVRSDNLATNFDNGWYSGPNQIFTNANTFKRCTAKIKPNTTYTISKKNASNRFIVITSELEIAPNIPYKRLVLAEQNTNRTQYTFSTQEDENYLFFGYYSGTDETEIELAEAEIMIVEGSTAPSKYIPYYNETTNIYLNEPLRKIDGYSDYIDFINSKVVRNIDEIVLNGSETATDVRYPGTKNWYYRFRNLNQNTPGEGVGYILGSHYPANTVYNANTNEGICITKTSKEIRIRYGTEDTIENFKAWLQTHNVTVDYVLETPTQESITLPNIPTIDGNNTLNIETEITPSQVYIKYKSNE